MRSGVTRREILAGAGAAPLVVQAASAAGASTPLPDKASFAPMPGPYLDSGTMHPIPLGARDAVRAYLDQRATTDGHYPTDAVETRVKASFAKLINAAPEEIAFVQSTTAGEQLVIDALDFPRAGGRIVTDTLHFFGSFYLYQELAKQGVDVAWVKPIDNRISVEAMEKAITPGTRLVALSLVSTYNGFEHDLKRVCEIAHARGALVYADIIHAAGTIPIDVRATNVDFAATASYKWLMGDFGLGFLYARADLHDRLKRTRYGYYQLAKFAPHVYPFDPPGETIADVAPRPDMEGLFAGGTHSHTVVAQLDWSLDYILKLGVDRIVAHRQPLMARLRKGLAERGYTIVTPAGSRTPLLTCALEGAYAKLSDPLKAAKVQITLSRNRFRVCPSVFNDLDDIERLLAALPRIS
ncbi:aminotransferase class V-fold PLP-dependent enzyme [Sphingomonas sp. NIBR02145]|uniref:aminotransferase class V-fold PLP-dependent enzyme n=1 Tax=Sphingomonas sp. NIBR02145 TaxID=3014784 RepID=UPI0022B2F6DE|nr:aminotransferase class V-fold PLP-dependent enzyme [Sphingomonas sp. NIBR02145]WHU04941.1 aminotransferase class V-fold PLP-dependent enzyme [Sphingomonas sp. NIBR02145]